MSTTSRSNISLPSLDKALNDLEECRKKYRLSEENLKQQQTEIEKLRCEKQYLLSSAEAYKQKVRNNQGKLMEIKNNIDDTLLKINKADVANLYYKQKIKQFKEQIDTKTLQFPKNENIVSPIKYMNDKEDLLAQKAKLEQLILLNNKKMSDLKKSMAYST
ncbi:hypothetical protein FQR65_LT06772 [Abscondita terminalis]|nr:hypothetical protein FQR65_LT06772 [Abscondita terminalis]